MEFINIPSTIKISPARIVLKISLGMWKATKINLNNLKKDSSTTLCHWIIAIIDLPAE